MSLYISYYQKQFFLPSPSGRQKFPLWGECGSFLERPSAGLVMWQMRHMLRASRLWGPRALLCHAHSDENTPIPCATPILGASGI
jgi:hypothetical protein